jgi:hypothetical protein
MRYDSESESGNFKNRQGQALTCNLKVVSFLDFFGYKISDK